MINYKERIFANIAYLRKVNGLSRTAMSRKLHISITTLDQLEQGIFPPRLDFFIVYRVSALFGVETYDLMYTLLEENAVFN